MPRAQSLGYDYGEIVAARETLWERLHRLTRHDIALGDAAPSL